MSTLPQPAPQAPANARKPAGRAPAKPASAGLPRPDGPSPAVLGRDLVLGRVLSAYGLLQIRVLAFWVRFVDDRGVAHGFVRVDRDQQFLLPPDLRSWLPADHEVWFVIDVVESLDVSGLEASYRLGAAGRAPVSPTMLLTLLVWGYSRGLVSSRAIERACREDVAFRVICANQAPDHSTIARFRQRHERVASELFVQVLSLCERAGLVRLGTVAVDGTRMSANAALGANRQVERLRAEVEALFAAAASMDEAEDDEFGDGDGSGLPPELRDAAKRRERLAGLLAELDAEGAPRQRVNLTDRESRVMHSADGGNVQGFNAQVLCGEGQIVLAAAVTNEANDSHQLVPMLDELAENLDAAGVEAEVEMVLADAGYCTAANLAALDARQVDALIATTKRHKQPTTGSEFDPAAQAAALEAFEADQARLAAEREVERRRRASIFERVAATNADIRDHLDELGVSQATAYRSLAEWRTGGVEAITVPKKKRDVRRPIPRSDAQAARDAMADKLADPNHRARYKLRGHLVETFFGHTKHNRGLRRFSRRGLAAVNAEWRLIAMVHNIGRLATTG
jgi:transposase